MNGGQCHEGADRRRRESDLQSHKETMSILTEKRIEKLTNEEMNEMIQRLALTGQLSSSEQWKRSWKLFTVILWRRILGTNSRADRGSARATRSR